MPTEARPNLFLVGAQKSGTSALAGWLSEHPQVCMSFPKEPGFLAFGANGYTYPDGFGRAAPASKYVVCDALTYSNLFANATAEQHIRGEASTWYFAIPGMAGRIKAYNPVAKIIVILRNPIERAYSAWCHARGDLLEPCATFSAALKMEAQRGEVEFLLRYRHMGLYSQALTEYQATFPEAQLLVLFHDDLQSNPLALWREICVFLGIDPACSPVFSHQYNSSGQPRSRVLHSLLRSHRVRRLLRPFLPHRLALRLKQRFDNMNLQKFPAMGSVTRTELREYFRPDIQKLSHLTKRDLSAWLE